MMIHDFIDEYENLTTDRKKRGLATLFALIVRDSEDHEDLINDILVAAREVESMDGFGTEGADI